MVSCDRNSYSPRLIGPLNPGGAQHWGNYVLWLANKELGWALLARMGRAKPYFMLTDHRPHLDLHPAHLYTHSFILHPPCNPHFIHPLPLLLPSLLLPPLQTQHEAVHRAHQEGIGCHKSCRAHSCRFPAGGHLPVPGGSAQSLL